MSILINMEIPTSPVLFCIHPDGKVFADLEGGWKEYQAVPVPKHGDLIDRDMVLKKSWDMDTFYDAVRFAPTIIPEESEGE